MRLVFLLAVLALTGCLTPDAPAAGAEPDSLSFTDTAGEVQALRPSAANASVVFFMATWCPTCKAEAPMVAALHEEYAARGVAFYSLDFDPTETPEQLEAWKERYAQPWPHGVDTGMRMQRALGVTAESGIAVLDGAGATQKVWVHGRATEPAVRETLERILSA